MAASREEIDLIVNALSKGFDKLADDIKKVGNETEEVEKKNKKSESTWTTLNSAMGVAKNVYNQVAQAAKFAYDSVKEGAQLELARNQFDNLAESIGTTSDSLLNDLQRATKGMVSDAELISGATDIINLGLGKTQEETVRLATAVSTLGLDMQQVILTFANNSKARLDALGLSIEDVDAKVAELEKSGDFEGDAFDEAVLQGLEEKMTLLGDASQTTAGQLQILEAEWQNVTNSAKEGLANGLAPTIQGLSSTVNVLDTDVAKARGGWKNFAIAVLEVGKAVSWYDGILNKATDHLKEGDAEVQRKTSHLARQAEEEARVAAAIEQARVAQQAQTQAIIDYSAAAAAAAGVNENLADKQAQLANHTGTTEQAVLAANLANQQYFDELEAGAAALEETAAAELAAAEAAKAHSASMGDLFRQAIDTDGAIGLFNETEAQMSDRTIYVSNLTRDQRGALSDLQAEYEKAQGIINDYTIGAKGVGLTTEEVNEKVAEQQERMAELQAAMEPLLAVGGEYAAIQGTMTINQDALNQAIFDAADAQGASAEELAILGGALGLYSDEAVEAALKTALIQQKIEEMIANFDPAKDSVEELRQGILDYAASLDAIPNAVATDVQVTGVDEAINKVGSLQAQLNQLGNQLTPAEAAGAGQKEGGGVYAAGGADFVVPPGYPNDSYGPLWVQSGEHVQVTPAGQSGGGRGGVVQNNYFNNPTSPNAIATATAEKLGALK